MKTILMLLLLNGLPMFGFAQNSAKMEDIKMLLEISGSGKLAMQVIESMTTSFKSSFPDVPEEFWENFIKEANIDVLLEMIAPIYAKYYTSDDIKKLIRFYKTPLGKKVISSTPLVMQESMQAGEIWGQEIGEKVIHDLKMKGFIKDD